MKQILATIFILGFPSIAAAQCQSDNDCKGDRICENGACASPPAAARAPAVAPQPAPAQPAKPQTDTTPLMGMWTVADARGNSTVLYFHTPTNVQIVVRQKGTEITNAAFTYRLEGNRLFIAGSAGELSMLIKSISPKKLQIDGLMGDPKLNVTFKRVQ